MLKNACDQITAAGAINRLIPDVIVSSLRFTWGSPLALNEQHSDRATVNLFEFLYLHHV